MKVAFFYTLCAFALLACDKKDFSKELETLNKAISEVEQAENRFLEVDSAKASNLSTAYNRAKKVFSKYYVADTIDVELARKMTAFKAFKGTDSYLGDRINFLKEAKYTISQLGELKYALETGDVGDGKRIPEDKLEEYMALETKAASEITMVLNGYSEFLEKQIIAFDTLNPVIENVVDSLLRANGIEVD